MPPQSNALRAALIFVLVASTLLVVCVFFYFHAMHQISGNYTSDISMSSFCDVLTLTRDGHWSQIVKSEAATPPYVREQRASGTWTGTAPNQLVFSPGLLDDALMPPHTESTSATFTAGFVGADIFWSLPRSLTLHTNAVMKYGKPLTGNTSCPFFQLH